MGGNCVKSRCPGIAGDEAEVLAVVAALQAVVQFGMGRSILGSDSQNSSDEGNVLYWRQFDVVNVLYFCCSRSCNADAHELAKFGACLICCCFGCY